MLQQSYGSYGGAMLPAQYSAYMSQQTPAATAAAAAAYSYAVAQPPPPPPPPPPPYAVEASTSAADGKAPSLASILGVVPTGASATPVTSTIAHTPPLPPTSATSAAAAGMRHAHLITDRSQPLLQRPMDAQSEADAARSHAADMHQTSAANHTATNGDASKSRKVFKGKITSKLNLYGFINDDVFFQDWCVPMCMHLCI